MVNIKSGIFEVGDLVQIKYLRTLIEIEQVGDMTLWCNGEPYWTDAVKKLYKPNKDKTEYKLVEHFDIRRL